MDFILGIAEFLLQAIILLGVFLIAFAGVLALTQRKRGSGEEGSVEANSLNERFELHEDAVRAITDDPIELKSRDKEQKKQKKAERKAAKAASVYESDPKRREALGSTIRPSSWPDPGHDDARSGKWATRRNAFIFYPTEMNHGPHGRIRQED